jgi:TRAP-type C4-dicarboxylate transport system permease small subunit
MAFSVAVFGIGLGWLNDDGALLILGWFCFLLGVALLVNRDAHVNRDVLRGERYDDRLRVGWGEKRR